MKSQVTCRAFTLIELLLVVLILAVLATLVIPRISASASGAKSAKCDANVTVIKSYIVIILRNHDGTSMIPEMPTRLMQGFAR